jgi:hypothetical protein
MPGPTLDDLEGVVWGEPTFPSGLVVRCHKLRRTPVDELTLADLRLLVGQSISLPILMPRAVGAFEDAPMVEAYGYPGDLLSAVLRADPTFLRAHPELLGRVQMAAKRAAAVIRAGAMELDAQTRSELLAEVAGLLASTDHLAEPDAAPNPAGTKAT